MDRTDKTMLILGSLMFAVIAGVTFATSFDAIREVAIDRGVVRPHLGWAIPVGIDGIIIAASLAAWADARHSHRWHPFPVAVVGAAAVLSISANVAHAESTDWLSRALAAVPPAGLLLTIELGAWQLRRRLGRVHGTMPVGSAAAASVVDDQAADPSTSAGHLPAVVTSSNGDRHAHVWERLANLSPPPSSQRNAADRTDLSRHAIRQAVDADPDRWATLAG